MDCVVCGIEGNTFLTRHCLDHAFHEECYDELNRESPIQFWKRTHCLLCFDYQKDRTCHMLLPIHSCRLQTCGQEAGYLDYNDVFCCFSCIENRSKSGKVSLWSIAKPINL